jgi:hypothetical protein
VLLIIANIACFVLSTVEGFDKSVRTPPKVFHPAASSAMGERRPRANARLHRARDRAGFGAHEPLGGAVRRSTRHSTSWKTSPW